MRCFCTVVSRSHIRPALILARSLRDAGNLDALHVLVIDGIHDLPTTNLTNVVWYDLSVVRDAIPPLMPHYFDAFELCNALKPFVIARLFANGAKQVIYLDSDILVVGSFEAVWRRLDAYAAILTPHQFAPSAARLDYTNEIEIVDQGIFNGGFTAWRSSPAATAMLNWMTDRFPRFAFNRRQRGMFVDQKLLPLLPVYFPNDILIDRDPTLNIAFWNVHERNVRWQDGRAYVGGHPVVFFHLSGYKPDLSEKPCLYLSPAANLDILRTAPWFEDVMSRYRQAWTSTPTASPSTINPDLYHGMLLSPDLRMLLFRQGHLNPSGRDELRIRFLFRLRLLKRWVLARVRRVR